jgi:hypothetical protein
VATDVKLLDTKTGSGLTCASSKIAITLPGDGIPHAGSGFGTLDQFGFSMCSSGRAAFGVIANAFPWSYNIASFNTVKDEVHGSITGMDFTVTSNVGCGATVDGTAAGFNNGFAKWDYSNKDGKLTLSKVNGRLIFYNVTNCGSLFGNNDPAVIEAVYTVAPPQDIT